MVSNLTKKVSWCLLFILCLQPRWVWQGAWLWECISLCILIGGFSFAVMVSGEGWASFRGWEWYGLFLMLYFPFVSAVVTNLDCGQPFFYGLLKARRFFYLFFSIFLMRAMRRERITMAFVMDVFIFLAWVQLVFSVFAFIFGWGMILDAGKFKGEQLRADNLFILFGFFYYFSKFFLKKENFFFTKNLFFGGLFFSGLFFIFKERAAILSVALAMLCGCFLLDKKIRKSVATFFFLIIFLLLIVFGASPFLKGTVLEQTVIRMWGGFKEATHVVVSGEKGKDASSNVRLDQVNFMLQHTKHWFLGDGEVSNQWTKGRKFERERGKGFFYAQDIGFIGIIYMHGLIGFCLMSWLFISVFRCKNFNKHQSSHFFFLTFKMMFFYSLFYSITTAFVSISIAQVFLITQILIFMDKEDFKEKTATSAVRTI